MKVSKQEKNESLILRYKNVFILFVLLSILCRPVLTIINPIFTKSNGIIALIIVCIVFKSDNRLKKWFEKIGDYIVPIGYEKLGISLFVVVFVANWIFLVSCFYLNETAMELLYIYIRINDYIYVRYVVSILFTFIIIKMVSILKKKP